MFRLVYSLAHTYAFPDTYSQMCARTHTHTHACTHAHTHTHANTHTAPPLDTDDIIPAIVPQVPPVDPETGDDGTTENSARITFTLPDSVERNGALDRYVGNNFRSSLDLVSPEIKVEGPGCISVVLNLPRPSYRAAKKAGTGKVEYDAGGE